ncbi:MAG: CopG family transcriptional regulator [Deltaproteobacteria bacterium]|nr:CopG family transcriptional regulator [Deltaproteobacteria bacterium]
MGQVTIYLDKQSETILRKKAKRSNMSLSKWVAKVLKEKTNNLWSNEIKGLAGAWPDFEETQQLRNFISNDVKREDI